MIKILKYINHNNFTLNKASIKELPNALMNVLENYDTHKDQFSDFVQNKGMLLSAINQLVVDKAHYFNMIDLVTYYAKLINEIWHLLGMVHTSCAHSPFLLHRLNLERIFCSQIHFQRLSSPQAFCET
jgi:hypothetical protein